MKAILKITTLIAVCLLFSVKQYAQTINVSPTQTDSIQNELQWRQNITEIDLLLQLVSINKEIAINQEYMINELYQNQLKINSKIDSLMIELGLNLSITDTIKLKVD